ncbi:MAG: response regulator transcription factor [Chloroflexota bacterium]
MSKGNPIRILLADDHPVVRDGLATMLETQADFTVVAAVEDGTAVLEKGEALQPDVVLLDLEMPKLDGLETLKRIHDKCEGVRVIVFTAFDTDDRIIESVKAGAKGYLLKGAPREDIFNAIRVVSQGGSLLQPIIASKLMAHISQQNQPPMVESLTERESEVLNLLAEGMTNREIASELVVTERTIKFHVSAILGKLNAANRTEAVSIALQQGLLTSAD